MIILYLYNTGQQETDAVDIPAFLESKNVEIDVRPHGRLIMILN